MASQWHGPSVAAVAMVPGRLRLGLLGLSLLHDIAVNALDLDRVRDMVDNRGYQYL